MQCTGYDRHHHAIKRWDISYRTALDQGRTPSEAEAHAGEWNLRVKPFRGKFADYQEPEIT